MEYSYKFRLYPTKAQEQQIQRTFGCCRYVWNHYLACRNAAHKLDGHTMNYYECAKDMTSLKKELSWLKEVDAPPCNPPYAILIPLTRISFAG